MLKSSKLYKVEGIPIKDFERSIGVKKEIAMELMNKIINEKTRNPTILSLNENEFMILFNSFDEIFRQIEEWEFQTLFGITITETKKLRDRITQDML